MGFNANSIVVLSHTSGVGGITVNSSGFTRGYSVGEYTEGHLFVYVSSLAGTNPRVTPIWQISPNGNRATGGHYLSLRGFATSLKATGLAMITLPPFGKWGRLNYSVAGTGAAIKLQAWLVAKGGSYD